MPKASNHSTSLPRSAPGWTLLVVLLAVTAFPWCLGGWALFANLSMPGILLFSSIILTFYHPKKKQLALTWLFGVLPITLYLLIQALNPSYEIAWDTGLRIHRLQPLEHIAWLPTSVKSTFWDTNPWRFMLHWIPGLMLLGSLPGYSFPRSKMRFFLGLWVIGGTLLATFGILSDMLHWDSFLGLYHPANEGYRGLHAGFIYKNHAGAFLNLCLGGALFLAWESKRLALAQGRRSHPGLIWLTCAGLIAWSQVLSKSRAGLILTGLLLLVFTFEYIRQNLKSHSLPALKWGLVFAVILGLGLATIAALNTSQGQRASAALAGKWKTDHSYTQRIIGYKAEAQMIKVHPLLGYGAGSFIYRFPEYQNRTAESETMYKWMKFRQKQWLWRYAHCDYLQLPIELGIVGFSLLLITPIISLRQYLKAPAHRRHQVLILTAGIGTAFLHAIIDFPFQNPAIIVTLLSLGVWIVVYTNSAQRNRVDVKV